MTPCVAFSARSRPLRTLSPLISFYHWLVCSPPRSLLHNTKVGADRCTVDVSTGCVIVSLEPHASEPTELCVLSISRLPSMLSVPSWTCLSLSSLLTASILRSLSQHCLDALEPKHHRDLVQNHTCSSTPPVLDHAAFFLAYSTSKLTPVSVFVKMVSFHHCDKSCHTE